MIEVPEALATFELPTQVLELPAVAEFTEALQRRAGLDPVEADLVARSALRVVLGRIGRWYARAMAADVEAVFRLREDLTSAYRQALASVRGQAGVKVVDEQAFARMFDQLVGYVDDLATAREVLTRPGVSPDLPAPAQLFEETVAVLTGSRGTASPEPADLAEAQPRINAETDAERAVNRAYNQTQARLDPPSGPRRAPVRDAAEAYVEQLMRRYLRAAGVPDARTSRVPLSRADLAADAAIGSGDPLRAAGYELYLELPPDLQAYGPTAVQSDGLIWTGPDEFEFAEHKSPVLVDEPSGHYGRPAGQLDLLRILRVRGMLAERIDGCRGWRYSSDSPWLSDVVDWTVKSLLGDAGEPPVGVTDALITAINQMRAAGETGLGRQDQGRTMTRSSFLTDGADPAAILSDGVAVVPLWSVSSVALSQSYQLPPIGSLGMRALSQVHDDTISISASLVGQHRFTWMLALQQLAEASRRGSALTRELAILGARVGGLVLVTSMTVRTDIQVQTLSFTAGASRRDVLDVQLGLAHLPLPSAMPKLLDAGNLAVRALGDPTKW